jgi:integrase
MAVWKKTKFIGIRYREHSTRKHGVGADKYYALHYKVDGKVKDEAAGWASEGWTAEKAFKLLSSIRENIKAGTGPKSLAETRAVNEAQAAAAAKEIRAKIKGATTFADFWEKEYWPVASATKTARTLETESGYYAKWIKPALGDIPLRQLDAAKIEALALRIQKAGKSAGTVVRILGIVSLIWNRAADRDIVTGDCPCSRVKKPKQDNQRMRFLTEEEARALLEALAKRSIDVHDEALLSLFSGLRAGEIHALTWADVDLANGALFIRDPKSKRNRHAPITGEVRAMLERRHKGQAKSEFVFPADGGKLREWVPDTFARIIDELGFNNTGEFTKDAEGNPIPVKMQDRRQRVVFHSLRHTFASWLVAKGVPLYTVAQLMGHSTIVMTQRYSHLAPDSMRQAAMELQGILDKKPAKVTPFLRVARQ